VLKKLMNKKKLILLVVIAGVALWAYWSESGKKVNDKDRPHTDTDRDVDKQYIIRVGPSLYMPGTIPQGVGKPLEQLNDVAEKFEAIYPDTKIEYEQVPSTVREWIVTQLSAGIAPDIFFSNVENIWQDIQKGWYIPLDAFLCKPNQFIRSGEPGSLQWWDVFKYEAITRGKSAPNGKTYCISLDMVETGFFYNKDIFDELHIDVPQTWTELIDSLSKIKDAGYIPLVANVRENFAGWGIDLIFDQLYYDILAGIDIKKDPAREEYLQGYLDWDEISFLYKKGFFTRQDKRWVKMWQILKELRQYGPNDISFRTVDPIKLFISQQGAIFWFDTRVVQRLSHDPDLAFDWGVFYPPPISERYCQYASGHPMCVIGGSAMQYVVSNSAIRDTGDPATSERLKRCIAFLQFLTTPENAGKVVNEVITYLPNVKGTHPHEALLPFDEFLQRRYTTTKWTATFDMRFNEILERMFHLYLDDGLTEDEFLQWMEDNLASATDSMIRRKKPDFTEMQYQWAELAPLRETMEDLPDAAK